MLHRGCKTCPSILYRVVAVVMKGACPGGALVFFPNMPSQKDDEDLHEDPHEVLKSWTH